MLDDVIGLGEGGVGRGFIAEELNESDIVGALVPYARRALGSGLSRRHDRGERLVIDRDQFGRVVRLEQGLRHHEGNVITSEAHAVFDERGIGRPKARAVAALEPTGNRKVAPSRRLPIRAREHREHAGRCLGPARID